MSGQGHSHRHHDREHHHDHGHEHGHGHHHDHDEPYVSLRARALELLLVEKGLITSEAIDRIVSTYEHDIGPMVGARVVARAWTDPEFKARLLADGTTAVRDELGLVGAPLMVLENTPDTHHMVVCTLCSCYPWHVLGLPPRWYKDHAYRSRAVIEPRAVLRELGLELGPEVRVEVWDSSADLRYLVLPERPAGTEGWTEEQLAAIVTRDAMIGVARVRLPADVPVAAGGGEDGGAGGAD